MIIYIRSYSIQTDSRLLKYIQICEQENIDYLAIGWNKDIQEENTKNIKYFNQKFKLGKKWFNIFAIFKWWMYVFKTLRGYKNSISTVHSVDLDCGLVGLFFCKLHNKKHIYDIYDVFTENRNIKGITKFIINCIERMICIKSHSFIMPERFRLKQLGLEGKEILNFFQIENVPSVNSNFIKGLLSNNSGGYNKIKLAYAGSLEPRHRGIEYLLQAVSQDMRFSLDIAGIGPLTELCKSYSSNFENINFYGRVTPDKVYAIESQADVIIGLYYKSRDNHFYASPNKYYEHLLLGKPMVTTLETPPGFKVLKYQTGYAIGDEYQDIVKWMNDVYYFNDIDVKGIAAKKLWLQMYENYFEEYLKPTYLKSLGIKNV